MPFILPLIALAMSITDPAAAQAVQRHTTPGGFILESVEVNPGAGMLILSGQGPAFLDPANKALGYGDTRTQVRSTLDRIERVLKSRGYALSDLIKLVIYTVPDPKLGRVDYQGMNAGFREYFGTAANPNTVARVAIEIAGIQFPGMYVEIEATAARKR